MPPPAPELTVLDFDSDALRKQLADERDAALRATSESGPVVQRKFYVGWEMHYGYYLMPVDDPGMHIAPDFLDDHIVAQFDDFAQFGRSFPAGYDHPHLGKKIVCDCIGVEWSLYSTRRFLVESATLSAI